MGMEAYTCSVDYMERYMYMYIEQVAISYL